MSDDKRITFQVPSPAGMIDVGVPVMSAHDANIAAGRVSAVIRAMFAVVADNPAVIEAPTKPGFVAPDLGVMEFNKS